MAKGKSKIGRAVDAVETRILVHEGKKSLRAKLATVKRVTRKAAKAALVAGAVAAATVVLKERRKRRALRD